MAQQSQLEMAITSITGVAASRLSCADSKGHAEGLYSTSFFMYVDIEPADVLLHRAEQLFARRSCIPKEVLGELSLWIDAQLICWHWINQDIDSRNSVSEMYKALMVPELLKDDQVISSLMSVVDHTEFIVRRLIGSDTSVAAALIKKSLSPAKERVRYVPDMFSRAMLEPHGRVICTLMRAVAFGTVSNPHAIAPIKFRLAALNDDIRVITEISERCTKRGLVIALNEALSVFPNSMVRMLVPRCETTPSIRCGLFDAKVPILKSETFRVQWPKLFCRPPEVKMTSTLITQLGGYEHAQRKFKRFMVPYDRTPVRTPAEFTLLKYCASVAGAVRLLRLPFKSRVSATVCVCLGCMSVLSNVNGRKGKRGKLGVILVENEVRCSVCHSSAVLNIPMSQHILVDDSAKSASAICNTCETPAVVSGMVGTSLVCSVHASPPISVKPMCAICDIPLYRPSHQVNIDDTPASLCAQHQGIFPSPWMTRKELHTIRHQVVSKRLKTGL